MHGRPGDSFRGTGALWLEAGDVVLSHPVSRAVPSALRGLTTVFGMGTGVALAPLPPARAAPSNASRAKNQVWESKAEASGHCVVCSYEYLRGRPSRTGH
jgi:hypothetical protein